MRTYSTQLFIIFAAVLIGLAYYSTLGRPPIRKVQSVSTAEAPKAAAPSVEHQLAREERRAERLRQTLAQIKSQQSSVEAGRTEIQTITARLQEIKNQLDDTNQEKADIRNDEQTFYRDQRLNQNVTKISLQTQLQQIETNLIALKNRAPAASPTVTGDIAALETQKAQLITQLKTIDLQGDNAAITANQQAQDLQAEVQEEQRALRREYQDLQANLDYWQKQQAAAGNQSLREQRIQTLQKELTEQDRDVSQLRQTLKTSHE